METLRFKRVAVLATDGVEQVELTSPVEALEKAGAEVHLVAPKKTITAWEHTKWGDEFKADKTLDEADPATYDAIVLPGGQMNPDFLRVDDKAVKFVKHFFDAHKPIGAICHGPWTLIETGMVRGRRMTSFHSIKTDLINAGATWVDEEVVVDQGLVTSRHPGDLKAFNKKLVEEIAEGVHA